MKYNVWLIFIIIINIILILLSLLLLRLSLPVIVANIEKWMPNGIPMCKLIQNYTI